MRVAAQVSQMALMAAIVATLVYWPVAVALAVIAGILELSLDAFITFGGALNTFAGLAAWWLLAFLLALAYAACAFPWPDWHAYGSKQ